MKFNLLEINGSEALPAAASVVVEDFIPAGCCTCKYGNQCTCVNGGMC